jgi:hypothetical protein
MSAQVVPSAVPEGIIVKFLTKGKGKAAEVMTRLRAQFDDDALSKVQMHDWSVI